MAKLSLIVLACFIALALAQDDPPPEENPPADSGSGSCSGDKAGFTGTQPQNKGKPCDQHTHDNCIFIDEAIINCCETCGKKKDDKSAPPDNNKSGNNNPSPKKKKGCFHGEDKVQTQEYGTITIQELSDKRDAHVLTRNEQGALEYSPVRYWLHAQPSMSMKFVTLQTESGHGLSLTGEHLIYETDCRGGAGQAIYAKNVQVGRCLYVNQDGQLKETQVLEKGEKRMNGIYSPITATGSIVVNDVLASCYNYYENESLQKFVYQYMIGFQDTLANWLPTSVYQAAFNSQNGASVQVPRLILNFLELSNVFVH
jgi:hypothetical protein